MSGDQRLVAVGLLLLASSAVLFVSARGSMLDVPIELGAIVILAGLTVPFLRAAPRARRVHNK